MGATSTSTSQTTMVVVGGDAMRSLGRDLGARLRAGDVVLLHGDLGAGKTTLTQGIADALGVDGAIQSPTFTLMSEYAATLADGTSVALYHLDLYRLDGPDQLEDIGWDEVISPFDALTVVEWPERAGEWLPDRYIQISITYRDADSRDVTIASVPPERSVELLQ